MLSKVLAGLFAVAVLTAGGYAYWQYTDGAACCGTPPAPDQSASDMPPCCRQPSRASCATSDPVVPCCEMPPTPDPVGAEVVQIPPREVK